MEYELRFYAPDGEWVKDSESDEISELWKKMDDIGSKWIFYPIPVIVCDGEIVAGKHYMEDWLFNLLVGCKVEDLPRRLKDNEQDLTDLFNR
jgi:hypothetical protein